MRRSIILTKVALAVVFPSLCFAATAGLGDEKAAEFATQALQSLKELEDLCGREATQTWNRSLCGPTLVVDPKTRRYVARDLTQPGSTQGVLQPAVPVANTAVDWNGERWAMILWPLPEGKSERARLMLHESWHRLQPELGLSSADMPRDHLATVEGRSSIRLELRALGRAVVASGPTAMRRAACDALAIRFERYRQFGNAAASEAALERNEGLAEYTGWVAAGPIDRAALAASLAQREGGAEFIRNFAYATGPAYGDLLDRFRPEWRMPLDRQVDLGTMLLPAVGRKCAEARNYAKAAARFRLDRIVAEEKAIADLRAARVAKWRARLVDGAKATFSMKDANIVFNPNDVVSMPPEGDVYPSAEVAGPWGKLVVTDGLLLARDWSRVTVSGRNVALFDGGARGEGWTVSLAPGWQLGKVGAIDWAIRVVLTDAMRSSRR